MKRLIILVFGIFILSHCFSQQADTARYLIDGKYYTQQQLDSLQVELIKLEKTITIKKNATNYPFQNASNYLFNAGDLMIAGEVLTIAGICLSGIGLVSSKKYFYIASAGSAIASLICFIISGVNIKKASKEFQKISVENGKIVIKID